ncbi:hypothetical protein HYC85_012678 [Camellia sinensis]|uniref:Embryo sac development arrest 6 n=1 Tax=Camellia sinensis TaxID=4442 RepID=A0A7J7HDH6_CAMSI|nr:hypothetical protein HYC85_012678 [Camellia sinensis]
MRRVLTPGASRKRKEMDTTTTPAEPVASNRLLAGYMAYEFLSKGTLFGQKWDPARAEAVAPVSSVGESRRTKPEKKSQSVEAEPSGKVKQHYESYGDVARLLKGDGAHVAEIFNPTQLARWIQM